MNIQIIKYKEEKMKKQKQYNKQSKILTAEEYFQKGNIASENEEYNEAIFYYQKSIEINPQKDEAYYNMGVVYYNKGNNNKAIECFTIAARMGSENAQKNLNIINGD